MIETVKQDAREDAMQMNEEIFGVEATTELPTVQEAATIAPAEQRSITDVTAEIRFYKAQTVSNIIEIGKRLIEAKELLEHGQWGEWLANSIDISQRMAQNFMKIATEYSKTNPDSLLSDTHPNSAPERNLSYSNLLALLAVPADERDDFIEATHVVDGEEKTVDEMSKRELQRVIKERDEAIKRAERAESDAAGKQKSVTSWQVEANSQIDKNRWLKDENRRQRLDIDRLEKQPIDVAVQQPSEAQLEVMRENIRHEVMQSLALPDTYFAKKGAEEAVSIFMDAIAGAAANGIIALMRMDGKAAAKTLRVYISTLERYTSELNDRLKVMLQVDRTAKEGVDDVDW